MVTKKIFIVGLPRTATTSLCAAFLTLGYKTAHTAYTKHCFKQAQVIADTPIFADYKRLDVLYPQAKFIYLERDISQWTKSIKQLLNRMAQNVLRDDGGFNPHIKRAYKEVFAPFNCETINDDNFLTSCYYRHQQEVFQYFHDRTSDFITLNISETQQH